MNLKMKLGKRIQELRLKKGLKQSELAEMVGIATKTQSCIETGKNYPSANLIEKYASAFKIDEAEIFQITHIKSAQEMISEITSLLANASEQEIIIIYRLINNVLN